MSVLRPGSRSTTKHASTLALLATATLTTFGVFGSTAFAQNQSTRVAMAESTPIPGAPSRAVNRWGNQVWTAAKNGDVGALKTLLTDGGNGSLAGLSDDAKTAINDFLKNLDAREELRAKQMTESRTELDKLLAGEQTNNNMTKALREVLEMYTISQDKEALLKEPAIADLLSRAETRAREAESNQDILSATELFIFLNELNDVSGRFRPDVRRVTSRQEMLRFYAPQRLYELNNDRRKAAGEKELPPFNPLGQDYKDHLANVTQETVERALARSRDHVEQISTNQMVLSGLDALRTFVTTKDLKVAFPGLDDEAKVRDMVAQIETERQALSQLAVQLDVFQVSTLLDRIQERNASSVNVDAAAIVHEFGNGAMSRLDEYSQIIWPDELARFKKGTEGRFVGVGVQIEFNDKLEVRVVTPLEGSPAQRSGVHPDDIITKVDGRSVFGLSLDQVVDVITGREGTQVVLTLERPEESFAEHTAEPKADEAGNEAAPAAAEPAKRKEIEFRFTRASINVPSVKGWKRSGAREDDWDYFLDQANGIGYLRVSQFADETTAEMDRAITAMRRKGLNGLVFDLRYNPGGLLDQAVTVAQRFLPFDHEPIVSARRAGGFEEVEGYTSEDRASLEGIPVVMLVNEGSASASEIVSGAVRTYASSDKHDVDVIVLGSRTYGKGSVQNVWSVNPFSLMKLTTAYYMLPDKSIIHRRPGKATWGVEPHLKVEMLPKQNLDSIMLRRNADVLPLDENGVSLKRKDVPNPDDLLTKGIDLQLEAAKVLLLSRIEGSDSKIAKQK
ncbi:MAG: S41 family peptidase [Phycisphaerales bacterium]